MEKDNIRQTFDKLMKNPEFIKRFANELSKTLFKEEMEILEEKCAELAGE